MYVDSCHALEDACILISKVFICFKAIWDMYVIRWVVGETGLVYEKLNMFNDKISIIHVSIHICKKGQAWEIILSNLLNIYHTVIVHSKCSAWANYCQWRSSIVLYPTPLPPSRHWCYIAIWMGIHSRQYGTWLRGTYPAVPNPALCPMIDSSSSMNIVDGAWNRANSNSTWTNVTTIHCDTR